MSSDIRPLGAGDGRAPYYVQESGGMFGGRYLRLVFIDDVGEVYRTPTCAPYDPAAMTKDEAVIDHLNRSGAAAQAEAQLARRREEGHGEEVEPPPPVDPATDRFFRDEDY